MSFYLKPPPEEVYKLMHVIRGVFELSPQSENPGPTYASLMYQVHFNNILALFLIKNKQFSYASDCFETIIEIIKIEMLDIRDDVFLAAVSNYLTFVRAHQYSNVSKKIGELLGYLQTVYQGLLDKYLSVGCLESSLLLMLSTYKQHEIYFNKSFNAQNSLLLKKFEAHHQLCLKENHQELSKMEQCLLKNRAHKVAEMRIMKK